MDEEITRRIERKLYIIVDLLIGVCCLIFFFGTIISGKQAGGIYESFSWVIGFAGFIVIPRLLRNRLKLDD